MWKWLALIGTSLLATSAIAQQGGLEEGSQSDFTITFDVGVANEDKEVRSVIGACGVFASGADASDFNFRSAVESRDATGLGVVAAGIANFGSHIGWTPFEVYVSSGFYTNPESVTVAIDAARPADAHWWRCSLTAVRCGSIERDDEDEIYVTSRTRGFTPADGLGDDDDQCAAYKSDPAANFVIEGSIG